MQDFTSAIAELRVRLGHAATYLTIEANRDRLAQLEVELARPDLWDNPDQAQAIQREFAGRNDDVECYESLVEAIDDVSTLAELAREELDESQEPEIEGMLQTLRERFDELELRSLFTGEYDEHDAICEFNSGAGGVDAQDWCEMLMRMYLRWSERHGFEVEIDAASPGTEAGISSATYIIKGRYSYGFLRGEHGVHRLVRISPFDNNARRQTSFASVKVTPMIETEESDVVIDEKDLRIDVYRSSGAGGQHVNVTDSAVRITHLPTGIVVSCQNERSQHQNKDRAMQVLRSKLADLERQKHADKLAAITGEALDANFGSQIRNYVIHPYQQVKDLRSAVEIGNVDAVLDGDLDTLMEGYLRWERALTST